MLDNCSDCDGLIQISSGSGSGSSTTFTCTNVSDCIKAIATSYVAGTYLGMNGSGVLSFSTPASGSTFTVTDWAAITTVTSYATNITSGSIVPNFRIEGSKIIRLRGIVNTTTTNGITDVTLFTLPVGMRPTTIVRKPVLSLSSGVWTVMKIDTAGVVKLEGTQIGASFAQVQIDMEYGIE